MSQTLTRFRTLALVLVALLVVALPAAADAKKGGHSFGKWAKRHHVRGANKDADKDGLSNKGEFLSGTNPRKADSDRDGVSDANEDADHDGVDNGNEVRERTNPRRKDSDRDGVKDGQEDTDRDRLNNTGEDQTGDDPVNPDTDGDGVKDGDEGASKILEFDGSHLVLQLFGGATLAGSVDQDTEVWCGDDSGDSGDTSGDDTSGDDPGADESDLRIAADDQSDDSATDDSGDDSSDDSGDDSGDDSPDDGGPSCSIDDLQVGDIVRSASLEIGQGDSYFSSIELAP